MHSGDNIHNKIFKEHSSVSETYNDITSKPGEAFYKEGKALTAFSVASTNKNLEKREDEFWKCLDKEIAIELESVRMYINREIKET